MRLGFAIAFLVLGVALAWYASQTGKRMKKYEDGPNIVGWLGEPILGLAAAFGSVISLIASPIIYFT